MRDNLQAAHQIGYSGSHGRAALRCFSSTSCRELKQKIPVAMIIMQKTLFHYMTNRVVMIFTEPYRVHPPTLFFDVFNGDGDFITEMLLDLVNVFVCSPEMEPC